jgi:hypothetical protein
MPREEEVQKELKDLEQKMASQSESTKKKPESKAGKTIRMVLMIAVMALFIAIIILGFLRR